MSVFGANLVNEAGNTMQTVVDSVRGVADIMGEITAASTEQTMGIGQVNQAVMELDKATQQNAALVEEASAATGAMKEQADRLIEVVSVFKTGANTQAQATALRRLAR